MGSHGCGRRRLRSLQPWPRSRWPSDKKVPSWSRLPANSQNKGYVERICKFSQNKLSKPGNLLLRKALSSENGAWEIGDAIIAWTFQNDSKPWLHHVAHFPLEWTSNKFLPRCPSVRVIQLENYSCAICRRQSLKILYGLKTPHIILVFLWRLPFFLRSLVAGITILVPWVASLKEVGIIIPRNCNA